jgi:alpha-glucosidase
MFQRKPAVVEWWNGISAVIDLTNPETQAWFHEQLTWLQDEYGVDGFKLDAGDAQYYTGDVYYHEETHPNRQTELFAEVGLQYPMNEYRACWKMGGQPLVQRLRDKGHNWDDLNELIPDILAQGLMGYAYTCPDMIGGGEYRSFLNADTIDQALIVRSTQTHALMPMMQFSVAPWRVLDEAQLPAVKKMVDLHQSFADKIINLAHHTAKTGEPIVRPMEYVFPHQGYAEVKDQFMLGDDVLVAPMLSGEGDVRKVLIPKGLWQSDEGETIEGPAEIEVRVPLERLAYFRRAE